MMSDPSLRIDEIQSRPIFVFEIAPERMVVIERESTRVIKTEAWEMNNWTMVLIDTFVSTRRATTDESTTENLNEVFTVESFFIRPLSALTNGTGRWQHDGTHPIEYVSLRGILPAAFYIGSFAEALRGHC